MIKKNYIVFLGLLFFLACFISLSVVFSATVTLNGGTFADVQSGVNTAGTNGELNLGNNLYLGSGNDIIIDGIDDLLIQGSSNSSRAMMDANLISEVFQVGSSSSNITFKYINFVNGNASDRSGAGINAHGTITLEDCGFINSYGASGTALMIHPNAPNSQVINCQFIGSRCIYENTTWGPRGQL